MTREEQIRFRAGATADGYIAHGAPWKEYYQGFIEGAKWADANPSLSSDLNEATEEIVKDWLAYGDGEYKKLVIAGVEWIARQGVTFESIVEEWSNPSGHRELSGLEEILKDFNWQDKVIVQIRKA